MTELLTLDASAVTQVSLWFTFSERELPLWIWNEGNDKVDDRYIIYNHIIITYLFYMVIAQAS
jgi:hypothetical protein